MPLRSAGPIIDGPKALTESYTRLATEADTVLVGALTAAGLARSSAEDYDALAADA